MSKVKASVAGVAAAAALLAGASLLATGGTSGAQAPGEASGSAFGVSATGLIPIAPTPTAPPNGDPVAKINEPAIIKTDVLTAMANLDAATGDFTSTATVADVSALQGDHRHRGGVHLHGQRNHADR